jgi:hypothetical protein
MYHLGPWYQTSGKQQAREGPGRSVQGEEALRGRMVNTLTKFKTQKSLKANHCRVRSF